MRRRLLVAFVAVLAAALVAFAVPLAVAVRGLLVSRALDSLQGSVEQTAVFIDETARTCPEVQLRLAVASRSQNLVLTLFTRDGTPWVTTGQDAPPAGRTVATAATGRAGRAHVHEQLVVAVPLSTAVCPTRLVLQGVRPDEAASRSIIDAWAALGLVGAGVLALGVGAATLLGRRLSGPFEDLAASARRLGDGDFSARAPRSGLPEADAIAAALDATADRLGRAIQRGSAFTADASHQLRTPLTALRLQLEALEASGADPTPIGDALAEADRLERTIDELVALTRLDVAEREVAPVSLVTSRLAAWQSLAAEQGRALRVEELPCPAVRVRPGAIGQALQVLLDNALEHGRGDVTVRVGPSLPDGELPGGVRLCVLDEGPGIPAMAAAAPPGRDRGVSTMPLTGGRGLGLARSLVEGEGGRLVLEGSAAGTRACIVLPAAGGR